MAVSYHGHRCRSECSCLNGTRTVRTGIGISSEAYEGRTKMQDWPTNLVAYFIIQTIFPRQIACIDDTSTKSNRVSKVLMLSPQHFPAIPPVEFCCQTWPAIILAASMLAVCLRRKEKRPIRQKLLDPAPDLTTKACTVAWFGWCLPSTFGVSALLSISIFVRIGSRSLQHFVWLRVL
jgi:hypothetical protein